MAGYLIKDTTREEREQIVAESLDIWKPTVMAAVRDWRKCIRHTSTGRRSFGTSTWNFMQVMYPERKCPAVGLVLCNFVVPIFNFQKKYVRITLVSLD